MDEATPGVNGMVAEGASMEKVQRLAARADGIRDNLGELVDELNRRRHRLMKPLLVGAIVIVGAVVVRAVLRRRRRPPSRLRAMVSALRSSKPAHA